jgi:tetratricopeptide (TPR) repeat protein
MLLLLLSGPLAASLDEAAELLAAGNPQAAMAQLVVEPVTHRSRLLQADALAGLQRNDEAEALYRALIAELPQDPAPYNNLASLYAATGRLQEASELLTEAMKSDPRYAAIYKNLSRVYVEMSSKSYARALRLSEQQQGLQLLTLDYHAVPSAPLQLAALEPAAVPPPASAPAKKTAPTPAVAVSMVTVATAATRPTPTPTPTPVVAPVSAPAFDGGGAIAALKQWAAAWSAQDVEGYLGAYDAAYLPPRGLTLAQWQAERRIRLRKPGKIEVVLSDFEVNSSGGGTLTVKLVQRYRSDNYRDRTRKGFVLVPHNGGWKIGDEYTIEVLN